MYYTLLMHIDQSVENHLDYGGEENFVLNAVLELLVDDLAHATPFYKRHYDP